MKRRVVLVALALACVFAAGAFAFAGHGSRTAAGAKPTAVGIKVHGKWVIEVRSRTGKVLQRRRFENSLTPFGAETLAGLLNAEWTLDQWGIGLGGAFTNGGISNPTTTRTGGAFLVSGSATAGSDVTIHDVQTVASREHNGTHEFATITFKSLATPIQVLSGQQVLAKVTITFS